MIYSVIHGQEIEISTKCVWSEKQLNNVLISTASIFNNITFYIIMQLMEILSSYWLIDV